ncbi:UNVERIFIED_CONTAM: hypothetical protein RMT77_006140 [Armadillidium vulgare]
MMFEENEIQFNKTMMFEERDQSAENEIQFNKTMMFEERKQSTEKEIQFNKTMMFEERDQSAENEIQFNKTMMFKERNQSAENEIQFNKTMMFEERKQSAENEIQFNKTMIFEEKNVSAENEMQFNKTMIFEERNQSVENENQENYYSNAEKPKILSHMEKMFPDFNNCSTKKLETKFVQHSNYWVLQNYIKASETFLCNATITYTTLGELGYLHNLAEIATRWQGPVSAAVLAPGEAFEKTLDVIFHLRECGPKDVKKFVTFHIFFNFGHFPQTILNSEELLKYKVNCSRNLKDLDVIYGYRWIKGLLFPINIARNIAWQNAGTYFVFPSDIELYPSVNIIPEFLKLLERRDVSNTTNKRVFVLPVFELEENVVPPKYKEELLILLRKKKAHIFHEENCRPCHEVPKYDKWLQKDIKPGLSVHAIGKRKHKYRKWEPIFITTTKELLFDERFMSEGRGDKMVQNYIMCLLDYEYHVLDNAFIVHEPGLIHKDLHIIEIEEKQDILRETEIKKECDRFYGKNKYCYMA